MKVGKYNLSFLNPGRFKLDGGAMFGIIPKPLWGKTNPADTLNRIQLTTRLLLLQNGKRSILVDTGMGTKWDEKSKNIYDINQSENPVEHELGKFSLTSADITDVILTHLHFDHTGGSTKLEGGKLVPAFPNAKYYVQKKNYDWAVSPSERDRGSYIKDNFVPLYNEGVLNFIEGSICFDDEIEFIVINGHTFSQQLVKLKDSSGIYLYCCDLFPTTSHIPVPYVMGYDLQPLVTVSEKKKILAEAAAEEWTLIFEHDPVNVMAAIYEDEKGFKVKEAFNDTGA